MLCLQLATSQQTDLSHTDHEANQGISIQAKLPSAAGSLLLMVMGHSAGAELVLTSWHMSC